jgi:hypothetical protein
MGSSPFPAFEKPYPIYRQKNLLINRESGKTAFAALPDKTPGISKYGLLPLSRETPGKRMQPRWKQKS